MRCLTLKMNAVLARVIGRSSRPFLQTMILDAGKNDAARPGEAVMDENGMIGRVYLTGQHTSWVILLTDINSRIPISIAPGGCRQSWPAITPPCRTSIFCCRAPRSKPAIKSYRQATVACCHLVCRWAQSSKMAAAFVSPYSPTLPTARMSRF